jgi:hypothetical protein
MKPLGADHYRGEGQAQQRAANLRADTYRIGPAPANTSQRCDSRPKEYLMA